MSLVARGESFSADSGRVRAGRSAAPARNLRGSHHSAATTLLKTMIDPNTPVSIRDHAGRATRGRATREHTQRAVRPRRGK
jgi:hypothetical protein